MRLGEYLQLADIPQAKFAVLLGVRRATISRYISGTKIPSATDMLKIWGLSRGLVGLDDWMPPHSAGRTVLTASKLSAQDIHEVASEHAVDAWLRPR
jgi:hypothetical protein